MTAIEYCSEAVKDIVVINDEDYTIIDLTDEEPPEKKMKMTLYPEKNIAEYNTSESSASQQCERNERSASIGCSLSGSCTLEDSCTSRIVYLECKHQFCYKNFVLNLQQTKTQENVCFISDCYHPIADNIIKAVLIRSDYISFLELTRDNLRKALKIQNVEVKRTEEEPLHTTRDLQREKLTGKDLHELDSKFNGFNEQHSELLNLQTLDSISLIKNVEPFKCPICFDEFGVQEGVILRNCLHSFCKECVSATVQHSEEPRVICPFTSDSGSCEFFIQDREIRGIVSPEIYELHLRKGLTRAEANLDNVFHCKTPDCVGFVQHEAAVTAFRCPVCDKVNCVKCMAIHEEKTCEEYQFDLKNDVKNQRELKMTEKAVQKMLKKREAMLCPQCDVLIQKVEGCDYVLCASCKLGICYRIRKPRMPLSKMVNGVMTFIDGCHCNEDGKRCHPKCGVETEEKTPEISGLLRKFADSAKRNYARKKPGYRHDSVTKMFQAFIKMIAELLAYETLHANFPLSIPSVSTVNRFICDNGPQIIEGSMRTNELVQYLQSRNLPLKVSLSEDATRIIPKISYDPKTNQLIGFALPLDVNGMPTTFSFPARNLKEIKKHFTNPSNVMSSTVYVQMAQPIDETVPPFCLMIFLTDSTFTAKNVLKRWKFQAQNLKENGITIDNMATDGDPRPLSVMKCLSRIGIQNLTYLNCEWFSCGGHVETTFTQDLIHIITKLRNRLLKFSRLFPIGNKVISWSYLKYLIMQVSKDKHSLNPSDIEPKDRQNFLSAQKICSDKVIQFLLDYIPGCEGTALYLKAMNYILNAYLNIKIKSKERIFFMWYAVFFFRAWRSWLLNSEKVKSATSTKPKKYYNLKDNFISSNCYTCIEINAHTLVKKALIGSPSEGNSSKFFFPNLYGSQPCEAMFRLIRSFTSTFSTIVNCTMHEIIHRIKKIQLQNDIIRNSNGEIAFPKFEKKVNITSNRPLDECNNIFESLSRTEVISEIENARKTVICDLEKLGINTTELNFHCQIKPVVEEDIMNTESDMELDTDSEDEDMEINDFFESDDTEPHEEIQEDLNLLSGITGDLLLRDYQGVQSDDIPLEETSPFLAVIDKSGKEMVVRKSSICWLLSENKFQLSSDRLQRVQQKEYTNNSERITIVDGDNYFVKEEIAIGEWCIFSKNLDERNVVIGLVLGFSYKKGRTFKDREYSKSSAPVQSNRTIGVLCTSYSFNSEGVMTSFGGDKHKYIPIESYVGTIKQPSYKNKRLTIPDKLRSHIQTFTEGP